MAPSLSHCRHLWTRANKDAEAAKARPDPGDEIDPNWRERQEQAEATLKKKAGGNVVPGPGSDRKPGAAA